MQQENVTDGDLVAIKNRYGVPGELNSCHTAIVDGYVVEGHVPAKEIVRLITERPNVIGIAVPGMPANAPGMDIPGFETETFNIVTFDASGALDIYASYP